MICAARNEAPGFRAESWAESRKRREDGADDRCWRQTRESAPRARVEAQSPTAQPRQEALRNLGAAERGRSKTLRLGRGERPLPQKNSGLFFEPATERGDYSSGCRKKQTTAVAGSLGISTNEKTQIVGTSIYLHKSEYLPSKVLARTLTFVHAKGAASSL